MDDREPRPLRPTHRAMRVSVVIPTYNCAPLVREAIASALAQTVPPFEVLVIDDGSTDDTRAVISQFGSPVRYVWKPNGGVSSARNRGLAEVQGDLIAFLDADDVWHPNKLRRQIEILRDQPALGLLGTGVVRWPGAFPEDAGSRPGAVREVTLDALVVRNHFVTSSVVVRREVARAVGEFDRNLSGPEDYDFWLRAAQRTPAANLPLPLTGYRDVGGSLSKHAARMEDGMRRILEKLETGGVFTGRPWLRRKAWAYYLYDCARMYRDAGDLGRAVTRNLGALARYPLPLRDPEAGKPVQRVRHLLGILRKGLRGQPTNHPRPAEITSLPAARLTAEVGDQGAMTPVAAR
jgi:glycosyltransferase involved in cell wall biosynthesis